MSNKNKNQNQNDQKPQEPKKETKSAIEVMKDLENFILERYKITRMEEWRVAHLCMKQGREKVEQAKMIEEQIKDKRRQAALNAEKLEDFTQDIKGL